MIKELRESAGMTQKEFGEYLNIPVRTIQDWERGRRNPPGYVKELIKYYITTKGDIKMYKIILKEEGQEEMLAKGNIIELVEYLEENYDNLFSWIESDHNNQLPKELGKVELPNFCEVETLRDLEIELKKVDMDWWALEVEGGEEKNIKDLSNNELIKIIKEQDSWDSDEFRELLDRAGVNYRFDEDPVDPQNLFDKAVKIMD